MDETKKIALEIAARTFGSIMGDARTVVRAAKAFEDYLRGRDDMPTATAASRNVSTSQSH